MIQFNMPSVTATATPIFNVDSGPMPTSAVFLLVAGIFTFVLMVISIIVVAKQKQTGLRITQAIVIYAFLILTVGLSAGSAFVIDNRDKAAVKVASSEVTKFTEAKYQLKLDEELSLMSDYELGKKNEVRGVYPDGKAVLVRAVLSPDNTDVSLFSTGVEIPLPTGKQ